ncbi:hypothetical protein Tco_0541306 [Tanacetum coccineum]
MDTIRLRWGSKNSWGVCLIAESRITCDNTNENTTLSEAQKVSLRITSDVRFRQRPTVKGVRLRMASSHTGNHREDDFTPLETIRRFLDIIGSKSLSSLKGRPSSRGGGYVIKPPVEYAKFIIASQTCTLTKDELSQLVADYDIPQNVRVLLPKRSQTILDAPLVHISRFILFGMIKLTTFAVMCKAYGSEPSLDLLRAFLNLGPGGDWLTLSNRGVSSKYTELLLEENNLGKKPFKDVVPLRVRGDPLFNQIATYPCNIRTFPDPILYLAGLKSFWKHSPKKPIIYHHGREIDFKSFMVKGIDVEFRFELEGGVGDGEEESPSNRSINNEALVIDVNPLNLTLTSHVAENVRDSDDVSLEKSVIDKAERLHKSLKATGKRKQVTGPSLKEACRKLQKVPPQASKFVGDVSDPLDVDSDPDIHEFPSARELKDSADCHFVVAHVTPPSWKQHLRDISLEKRYDIHDRAYMRHAVLDNMLNSRTHQLMSSLAKARVSCDVIREREIEKDKAYAELERKCNDALQDLDKILLCWTYAQRLRLYKGRLRSYMGLESEKERLKGSETQLLQEIDKLRQERATLVTKVIPHMATKLIRSDEVGLLVARLVKVAIFHGRCTTFKEVAALKEPFTLEKMPGYRSSFEKEFNQAGDELATASYPFISEASANPYASLEELLSKKPKSHQSKFASSQSGPLSSKTPVN